MDILQNLGRMKITAMAMALSSSPPPPPLAMVSPGRLSLSHAHSLQRVEWRWRYCPCSLQARYLTQFQVAASRSNRPLSSSKTKKAHKNEEDEDSLDEDALEALFIQLEKDLEKDQLSDDDENDMITDEEISKFEEELKEAISDIDDDEEALDEYPPLKLENWQLQKLAAALEVGRRKVSVKILTEELGLDREIVLDLLRNPPPELLLIQPVKDNTGSIQSAIKPDNDNVGSSGSDRKLVDPTSKEASKNEAEVPIFFNQVQWNRKKRMKKVQIATLEKVYRRTRRPTDAMVDNIIHLTNLPRKAIVKWFSDKRMQESPKVVYKKRR
jgi:hypothetical protein